jgi:ABC-type oligopeptide transport system substrate-binding subunit
VNEVIPRGDFDIGLWSWIQSLDSPPADIFACRGSANYTGYCDQQLSRNLYRAARIVDDRQRVGLLHQVDTRLARAVPAIPLFQNKGLWAIRASVQGVNRGASWDPEDWWLKRER